MEKLQGLITPINPCLVEEDLDVGWLEEFVSNFGTTNYKFEDPYIEESSQSLEDKIPFLQMLQQNAENASVVTPVTTTALVTATFPVMQEPNYFQLLLKLQHQKLMDFSSNFANPSELESSMTNTNNTNDKIIIIPAVKSETCKQEQCSVVQNDVPSREKRKRKRPVKASKNQEEVESQRMTHIAVERNRRRQMNDHLNALRSLMPPSYVQRGDQASIVGGAIDYVKEMEQLLECLQAQKIMRQQSEENCNISAASSTASSSNLINNMFVTSPTTSTFQFRNNFDFNEEGNGNSIQVIRRNINNEEFIAENRSSMADIKVVVIQNHVNLKIQCQRRPCQLLRAIVAFEELRLTILHLNISSLHTLVHYSFNLKIEDECKLVTADEIVRAVHHIFSLINLN